MKKFSIALLALLTLGSAVMPAVADTGNSQTSTNISTIEGNGNTVRQTNRQSISNQERGRRQSDTVNVQDALNDSFVFGDRNDVNQANSQYMRNRQRGRR